MKKSLVLVVCSSLLLCGCGTYAGSGAYVGGSFGSILGSAIGGLAGGPRGSDLGTVIGMAGGAAVGAAIGSSCQNSGNSSQTSGNSYDSGFDSTNSGDDRLYDFSSSDYTGNYSAQQPTASFPSSHIDELNGAPLSYSPNVEIVNARFVDDNQDNKLNRNETCKLIFEIRNRGTQAVYDVVPTVVETSGNKHIYISPNIHVEKIDAGKGIRYTAMVKADNRLKDGYARFCVSVVLGNRAISKVNEFTIPTTR